MDKRIEIIGPDNVVQIVADGEAANRAAGQIVMQMYSHITVSFCMAHCLNNLLKDIGNLEWIAPLIADASQMVTFINNHNLLRSEFLKKSGGKVLLKYSDTRFAFNFLMLHRLSDCQSAVRQLFISDEFTSSSHATTASGIHCRERAESLIFWEDIKTLDAMVHPVVHLLRVVDGMQPCIGKVYEAMDRMIESLEKLEPNPDRYDTIRRLCTKRWDSYASDLHGAAFVLDPEFQESGQENDTEVMSLFRRVLDRMVIDPLQRRKVRDQLAAYRDLQGSYGLPDAQIDRFKIGSVLWWEDYGSDGPELQRLAARILSQSVSTSCLEQLWSTYSHIASKKRNRLGVQRASDLVYISANLRMLCKNATKKPDPFTQWEMEQEQVQKHGEGGVPSALESELEEDIWEDLEDIEPSTMGSHDIEATGSCAHSLE